MLHAPERHTDAPPRVLIVSPEQWPRAHMRAALRHTGYDAIGAVTLGGALRHPAHERGRGPVRAIVLEGTSIGTDRTGLDRLLARHGHPPVVLLGSAVVSPPAGDWARTLRRPITVGTVVNAVAELLPLPAARRVPLDP